MYIDVYVNFNISLIIILYFSSLSSSEPAACEWGCNPHCHFTLLLRSLSFDHTVLLDFLISDETCFLEYCVLYLKHLRDHWQDLCNACCHIESSEAETHVIPVVSQRLDCPQSKIAGLRPSLVDYECSEDSEDEERSMPNFQMRKNAEEQEAEIDMRKAELTASRAADTLEKMSMLFTEGLSGKVILCLTELRTVISRLHSRGLFPYNPSSLLKLLLAVESKGQLENPTSLQLK